MASDYMLILNVMKSEWSVNVYSLCVCLNQDEWPCRHTCVTYSVTTLIIQLLKSHINLLCYLCEQVRCWDNVTYIIAACGVDDTCFESWQEQGLVFRLRYIHTGSGAHPAFC
jgi:hypothetical protein